MKSQRTATPPAHKLAASFQAVCQRCDRRSFRHASSPYVGLRRYRYLQPRRLRWLETKRPTGQTLLSRPKPSRPERSSCVRLSFSSSSFLGGLVDKDIITGIALARFACPLWVKSRHVQCTHLCSLYPRKRL